MSSPVLLIPGLACDHTMWIHQKTVLEKQRLVTVAELLSSSSIQEIVDHILEYAPDYFHVAGASMGGSFALELLRRCPQRVLSLSLLVTSADKDSEPMSARRAAMKRAVLAGRWKSMWRAGVPRFLSPGLRDDAALVDRVVDQVTSTSPEAFMLHMDAMGTWQGCRDFLSSIKVPTCVFIGCDDEITPVERQLAMAAAIPYADVRWIKACGHVPTMERPEATSLLMDGWLDSLERQAA